MKNFIVTLNGYGHLLKKQFRGKSLFDYADKAGFDALAKNCRWGYICLEKTFEKAYFNLFEEESFFPGEAFIRGLNCEVFSDEVQTFFLAGFLSHSEGRVIEINTGFSDKELYGLLEFVSDGGRKFEFAVGNGEVIAGFKEDLPLTRFPFPSSILNTDFERHLCPGKEFRGINDIISGASVSLAEHPINKVREDLSEPAGNLLWFWGMGKRKNVRSFAEKIGKETFYNSFNNRIGGLPELLGFKRLQDIRGHKKNSLLWLNSALDFHENQSIWLKRFEEFDRKVLSVIKDKCSEEEYRIIFIFDAFTDKNAVLKNAWGIYCLAAEPFPPAFRLKKYIKDSRGFIEKFSR